MKKLLAKKRDNKGFSLVELIVVILIMAVIAVALAPQVMKWVGKSKESTDANNIGQIESAVNAGVADYMAQNNTAEVTPVVYKIQKGTNTEGKTISFLADSEGEEVTKTAGGKALEDCILDAMNGKFPTVQSKADEFFWINITKTGSVTVQQAKVNPFAPTT